MKNKKFLAPLALALLGTTLIIQVASATGPTGAPPGGNLPDAVFNSVVTNASGTVGTTGISSVAKGTAVSGADISTGDEITGNSIGVKGTSTNNYGVDGISTNGTGVMGWTFANNITNAGVRGTSSGPNGSGIIGVGSGGGYGVQGVSSASSGVYGSTDTGSGVLGYSSSATGYAVRGQTQNGIAGYFSNNTTGNSVSLGGTNAMSVSGESTFNNSFKIDTNGNLTSIKTNRAVDGTTYTNAQCTADGGYNFSAPANGTCQYGVSVSDTDGLVAPAVGTSLLGVSGDIDQTGDINITGNINQTGNHNHSGNENRTGTIYQTGRIFTTEASTRQAKLIQVCANIANVAGPTSWDMITLTQPAVPTCKIHFKYTSPSPFTGATSSADCTNGGGSYNAGENSCTWTVAGYSETAAFCSWFGSPSPFVSGGFCLPGPILSVANYTGTVFQVDNNGISNPSTTPDAPRPPLNNPLEVNDNLSVSGWIGSDTSVASPYGSFNQVDVNTTLRASHIYPAGYDTATTFENGNVIINGSGSNPSMTAIGANTNVLKLASTGAFGPDKIEFWSDWGLAAPWRPASIKSYDNGSWTGGLSFITNGTGYANRQAETEAMRIDNSGLTLKVGNAYKLGGGSWGVYSDARLKDVKDKFTKGLAEILKISPVKYNYKKDNAKKLPSDQTYTGLIAQEVQKAIPEAVSTDKDGYLSINNDPIIWAMLNAIKELDKMFNDYKGQIDKLNSKVDQLQQENAQLKARLDKLEALVEKK